MTSKEQSFCPLVFCACAKLPDVNNTKQRVYGLKVAYKLRKNSSILFCKQSLKVVAFHCQSPGFSHLFSKLTCIKSLKPELWFLFDSPKSVKRLPESFSLHISDIINKSLRLLGGIRCDSEILRGNQLVLLSMCLDGRFCAFSKIKSVFFCPFRERAVIIGQKFDSLPRPVSLLGSAGWVSAGALHYVDTSPIKVKNKNNKKHPQNVILKKPFFFSP